MTTNISPEALVREIRDTIRSAYDLGYNDARNSRAAPGDNAPGYSGAMIERGHGSTLMSRLRELQAAQPQAEQQGAGDALVLANPGNAEASFIEAGRKLDCPACGGSGHADDVNPAVEQEPVGYCSDFDPEDHEFPHTFYYLAPGGKVPAGCTAFYTAPPAQVDLSALRDKVESLARRVEPISGQRFSYVQLDEVLALIDSQGKAHG